MLHVVPSTQVFDVMNDQEVIDKAAEHCTDAEAAATAVVRTAFQRGSEDNLTALVIQFGWLAHRAGGVLDAWKEQEAQRRKEAEELVEEIDMFA
jgi:serine/threonine protein phosphatase PrpC